MDNLDNITGTVERFVFQNTDTGFAVFVVSVKKSNITATGMIPNVQIGQEVKLSGNWIMHSKFGRQFEVKLCTSVLPTSVVGLKRYLGSGLIKGIGPTYAEKLVNYFGLDILKIIESSPERLNEVSGIGSKRIELIISAWKEQKEISNLMVFLQERGITASHATRIYKQYGNNAIEVLTNNPYRMAQDIWGVGFKTADLIAQKIGFSKNSPFRISAGVIHTLTQATQNGHLYVELNNLKSKTLILLELGEEQQELLKSPLHELYNAEKLKLITWQDKHYLGLSVYYGCEKSIVHKILNLIETQSVLNFNMRFIYDLINKPTGFNNLYLNEDQQKGIISSLQNKVTIITGGPGTGKTTLIKKLLEVLESEKINYKLAAPTGRAAKRIKESTGKFASTIHRLLEFDVSTMKFTHNEDNALKLDFLIIDEASMIDVFLAHAILKAMPHKAHLLLIGDIDQLPSVGPGNILNDLISSGKVPTIRLTQIFRQAQDSLIVVNAHKVNEGQFPVTFVENAKRDFIYIKEEDPEKIIDHLKNILFITLNKNGISREDSVVLTPMNRGVVGTVSLNHNLQQILNGEPTFEQITISGVTYKVKDKVMQIRNNYDKEVFNGDIGVIEKIDLEDKIVVVNFSDTQRVSYEFDELTELVLAYSISIHKSQGSEYGAVIIPLFMQHFMLLQRNLLYTAITRAKKLCILIGQPKAIGMALGNSKGTKRLTFLKEFLTGELPIT